METTHKKLIPPGGESNPGLRVTGGDTNHYTTEEYKLQFAISMIKLFLSNISLTKVNNINMVLPASKH